MVRPFYIYQIKTKGERPLWVVNHRGLSLVFNDKCHRAIKMKLITKELARRIPALYETENQSPEEKITWVKLFTPDADWTWYIIEYEPEDGLCYGWVEGLEKELGYFLILELEEVRGPLGLPIERDLFFDPTTLRELMAKERFK